MIFANHCRAPCAHNTCRTCTLSPRAVDLCLRRSGSHLRNAAATSYFAVRFAVGQYKAEKQTASGSNGITKRENSFAATQWQRQPAADSCKQRSVRQAVTTLRQGMPAAAAARTVRNPWQKRQSGRQWRRWWRRRRRRKRRQRQTRTHLTRETGSVKPHGSRCV